MDRSPLISASTASRMARARSSTAACFSGGRGSDDMVNSDSRGWVFRSNPRFRSCVQRFYHLSRRSPDQGVSDPPILTRTGLIGGAAVRHAQHSAEQINRIVLIQQQHHFSFLFEIEASLVETFLRSLAPGSLGPGPALARRSAPAPRCAPHRCRRPCGPAPGGWTSNWPGASGSGRSSGTPRPGTEHRQDLQDQLRPELGGELTAFLHSGALLQNPPVTLCTCPDYGAHSRVGTHLRARFRSR